MKLLFYLTVFLSTPLLIQAGDLTIKGSDTMLIMNQELAQAYMKKDPSVNIQVSGGGSGVGIAALRNNTTDIAAASRLIKPKESQDFLLNTGIDPIHYSVALDGVAMFVNENNPLQEITLDQLGQIFHGDITNWKQIGGPNLEITVYSRESTSGTYSFVKDMVLKDQDYTARAQTLAGTAQVYDAVAHDPKGIGYGGIGYNKGVKVLKVKVDANSIAYSPSEENVDKKLYPLSRSLNYYLNPRSQNTDAEKFIAWIRSSEGQRIVAKTYFALPGILSKPTPAPSSTPVVTIISPASASQTTSSTPPTAPLIPIGQNNNPASSTSISSVSPVSTPGATITPVTLEQRETTVLQREESVAQRETVLAQRENNETQREEKETEREREALQQASLTAK